MGACSSMIQKELAKLAAKQALGEVGEDIAEFAEDVDELWDASLDGLKQAALDVRLRLPRRARLRVLSRCDVGVPRPLSRGAGATTKFDGTIVLFADEHEVLRLQGDRPRQHSARFVQPHPLAIRLTCTTPTPSHPAACEMWLQTCFKGFVPAEAWPLFEKV